MFVLCIALCISFCIDYEMLNEWNPEFIVTFHIGVLMLENDDFTLCYVDLRW